VPQLPEHNPADSKPNSLAWPQLSHQTEVGGHHDRDDRVAAGGRMVGKQQDRLTIMGDL
jgi:hypothetical protein